MFTKFSNSVWAHLKCFSSSSTVLTNKPIAQNNFCTKFRLGLIDVTAWDVKGVSESATFTTSIVESAPLPSDLSVKQISVPNRLLPITPSYRPFRTRRALYLSRHRTKITHLVHSLLADETVRVWLGAITCTGSTPNAHLT